MDPTPFHNLDQSIRAMHNLASRERQIKEENHANAHALLVSSKNLESLLDGRSTFKAIYDSVEALRDSAPDDHDTLIAAFGLIIDQVRFQHPHTIVFGGFDESGNRSSIVAHFSQVVIRVVYVPRGASEPAREVGFHAL